MATTFAELLRRYRRRAGLSQEELAERAGLTASAVSQLERGVRRQPQPQTVRALADTLVLTPDERATFFALARARAGGQAAHDRSAALSPPATSTGVVAPRPPHLPIPLTSLIGRERELTAAVLLLTGGTRLLTLTGPGGVGKTRLALAAAERVQGAYPDGVVFIDLAPVAEPGHVVPAIAQALDVRARAGRSLVDTLLDALQSRRLLLVLDNLEQVIAAAPQLHDLLVGCPGLTLLVTSRERLRVSGEREYAVPPLPCPDGAHTADLGSLAAVPAVALFVQRAREAQPNFALTDANARAVAEICTTLDGLPLALELAAARARILSPQALLARLTHQLALLTGGARNHPARHQTLQATIAWSYNLLNTVEQALFRRLAVFVGGCTMEAARTVCSGSGDGPLDVLDGLTSLVEKNLLRPREDADGEPCFAMLETIRAYALERLKAADEETLVRRVHAAYYATFAESADLHGPARGAATRRLEAEEANLRAAMMFCQAGGDDDRLLPRFAAALGYVWFLQGRSSEGRAWCEAALARADAGDRPALRARVLVSAGQLAWDQGDLAPARALLEAGAAGARQAGDERWHARALYILGEVLWQLGEVDNARAATEESAAGAGAAGHVWEEGLALQYLGMQAFGVGDVAGARVRFEQSLVLLRRAEDPSPAAYVMRYLGYVAQAEGRHQEALGHMTESLALNREIDDLRGAAACIAALAGLAVARGQPALAARLSGAMTATLERAGATTVHPRDRAFHDRTLAAERAALGGNAVAALWAEGYALSPDAAVSLARTCLAETASADSAEPAPTSD